MTTLINHPVIIRAAYVLYRLRRWLFPVSLDTVALDEHYKVCQIYESLLFSEMADKYWRKRLDELQEGQYVYIIKDASVSNLYKVGKTNNPSRRLGRFDVILPFEVQIISIMPCTNMHQLEAKLHRLFRECRVRGEWFQLSGAHLEKTIALEARLLFVEPA